MQQSLGRKFWQPHIDTFNSQNMLGSDFCKKHNLNYDQFRYWRKKLSKKEKLINSSFVSAQVPPALEAESRLKISLPNGVSLEYCGQLNRNLIESLSTVGGNS